MIRIGLLQMTAHGFDQAANLVKGEEYCRKARAMGADIALFPEMWNIGYTFFDPAKPEARQEWEKQAISQDDDFIKHFQKLAKELDMAIALTYLERWQGAPRNSMTLIDRHGEITMTYAKVHTCDFSDECALTPGEDFYVVDLDTATGNIKVGAMICYDREFPESARILMLKGAEVILTPNACGLEENRLGQFRARAYENMVVMAMTNYAAPQQNGHSVAFDCRAFNTDESSRDPKIIEAGEAEGVYLAQFDLEKLRAYREYETWGNSYRKPCSYAILISSAVETPFIRPDSRR